MSATGEHRGSSGSTRWLIAPLVWLLLGYQKWISPMTPPTCRFTPSCSAYALTALQRHGLLRGSWLALRRLLRCHPWNPGGVDHVPARRTSTHGHPARPSDSVAESAHPALRNS